MMAKIKSLFRRKPMLAYKGGDRFYNTKIESCLIEIQGCEIYFQNGKNRFSF